MNYFKFHPLPVSGLSVCNSCVSKKRKYSLNYKNPLVPTLEKTNRFISSRENVKMKSPCLAVFFSSSSLCSGFVEVVQFCYTGVCVCLSVRFIGHSQHRRMFRSTNSVCLLIFFRRGKNVSCV